MSKSKFLIIIIIGLLLFNGILFFMLFKDHKRKEGPKNFIIEKLHLNDGQIKRYESYIQQHRKAINANELKMNTLRSNLYAELKYSDNSTKIDSLIAAIGTQQIVSEHINYNHFLEIKHICKPNQKNDFDELTNEIANLFTLKERK